MVSQHSALPIKISPKVLHHEAQVSQEVTQHILVLVALFQHFIQQILRAMQDIQQQGQLIFIADDGLTSADDGHNIDQDIQALGSDVGRRVKTLENLTQMLDVLSLLLLVVES